MNLTRFTDYSLRTLIYVGLRKDRLASIQQVSDAFRIPRNHLVKVVHALSLEGFLETTRGRGGGLALARPAAEIRVGDVVRAMEPGFELLECFDAKRDRCVITTHCRLKSVLHRALGGFLAHLDACTLEDLLGNREPLVRLLDGPPDRASPARAKRNGARAAVRRRAAR